MSSGESGKSTQEPQAAISQDANIRQPGLAQQSDKVIVKIEEGCSDDEYEEVCVENSHLDGSNGGIKRVKRKHKKSKNGCSICKERRIKCDKRVPACSNCLTRNVACPYLSMTPYQISRIVHDNDGSEDDIVEDPDDSPNTEFGGDSKGVGTVTPTTPSSDEHINKRIHLNEFQYGSPRNINLDNSVYQAHEIESALLPPSMSKHVLVSNDNSGSSNPYIPLKTNYVPVQPADLLPLLQSLHKPKGQLPLYTNTKSSSRVFHISSKCVNDSLDAFVFLSSSVCKCLVKRNYEGMYKLMNSDKVDFAIRINYNRVLTIAQIFNKLMRKTLLLLALDYCKNTLLKQKILLRTNYKAKLSISCECENSSVYSIGTITKTIKEEYLPFFDGFTPGTVDIFSGSLLALNECLAYHFKNGLKYDISAEEGDKSVKLMGIFLTGLYAIAMEKSTAVYLMTSSNIISAHLVTYFKRYLIQNYSIKILDEFKMVVDSLANHYVNNIDYENLRIFCKKHSKLLKTNTNKDSLLGYNNGYLVRIMNAFGSIIPFDISNLNLDKHQDKKVLLEDKEIIIGLLYYSLSNVLDCLIPSIENAASSSFVGHELNVFGFGKITSLMNLFGLIRDKELKLVGIYLIRAALFFKNQRMYYRNCLADITIDSLLDEENDLTINQRYMRLKKIKNGGIMDEIQMKSFMLSKGQFIKEWNYPNFNKLKPKRRDRVADNRILNHFLNDENALIEDFVTNNNGFFSLDYDCSGDLGDDKAIIKETCFVDGAQMRMLWKLSTYIRINNL